MRNPGTAGDCPDKWYQGLVFKIKKYYKGDSVSYTRAMGRWSAE